MRVSGSSFRWVRVAHALVVTLLLTPDSAPAQVQPFEMGIAAREAGLLRGLAQRLNKQNLLYQLHLADVRRENLIDTAGEIDRIIEVLRDGSPAYAVPKAWTRKIRDQIETTDASWGELRSIATASPYEFLRRTRQFLSPEARRADPLLLRYFDDLSNDLTEQAGRLLTLYELECEKTDFPNCRAARSSGLWSMLIERMVREAVLAFAGIDERQSRERLASDRKLLETLLTGAREIPLIRDAMSSERGQRGAFIVGLVDRVESDWETLILELDLVLTGNDRDVDIDRLVRLERDLVGQMQRLNSTMTRYAIARFGG